VTTTQAITFFPGAVDTGQKNPKTLNFSAVSTAPPIKTVLTIPACLYLKIKNKQKFNLQQ
jgi:hypothetical protein